MKGGARGALVGYVVRQVRLGGLPPLAAAAAAVVTHGLLQERSTHGPLTAGQCGGRGAGGGAAGAPGGRRGGAGPEEPLGEHRPQVRPRLGGGNGRRAAELAEQHSRRVCGGYMI